MFLIVIGVRPAHRSSMLMRDPQHRLHIICGESRVQFAMCVFCFRFAEFGLQLLLLVRVPDEKACGTVLGGPSKIEALRGLPWARAFRT
jgi:hypothetical protein